MTGVRHGDSKGRTGPRSIFSHMSCFYLERDSTLHPRFNPEKKKVSLLISDHMMPLLTSHLPHVWLSVLMFAKTFLTCLHHYIPGNQEIQQNNRMDAQSRSHLKRIILSVVAPN